MLKINKILYATDLSMNADYAFRYAVYLAKTIGAKVFVLHILEKVSPDAQVTLLAYIDETDRKKLHAQHVQQAIERLEQRLDIFCTKEAKDHFDDVRELIAVTEVREAYPAEEILKKAEQHNCDVIIMGAHKKGITHTFLGSVAKSVLRRSRIPTFIVPLPRGEIDLTVHDG